jgi:hypothetical protein
VSTSTRTRRRKRLHHKLKKVASQVDPAARAAYRELADEAELELAAAALGGRRRRMTLGDALVLVLARDARPTHELIDALLGRPMGIGPAVGFLLAARRPADEIHDAVVNHHNTPISEVRGALVRRGWSPRRITELFGP